MLVFQRDSLILVFMDTDYFKYGGKKAEAFKC